MADEGELVGGISVELGASDAKLIGDLAEAERLVQAWAKQAATVQLRANFAGGTGTPAGGGGDLSELARAIEQGFANANNRPPARPQRQDAPRPVFGQGAATAAASQQGQTALQRAINDELAKSGEVYNDLTGEVEKVGAAHRNQRQALEASTRSMQANTQVEASVASVDVAPLQAEIKSLVGVLGEFRAALSAAAEAAPAVGGGGGKRRRGSARAAAPGGDEEEEGGGLGFQTRMAAFQMAEEERGAARVQTRRASSGQLAFREAERQRVRELSATRKQYDSLSGLAEQFFDDEADRIGQFEDYKATAQLEALNNAPRPAQRPAPVGRTQQNETPQERQRRERYERDQEFADRANAPRQRRTRPPEASAVRAAQQRQEELFARNRTGIVSDEEREARIQEAIEAGRANVAAGTSTGRTSASRIASVLGGTGGRRLEADVRAAAARRELNAANRAALPFEREIAIINEDIANSTPKVAQGLRAQRDAFRSDPKVVEAFRRQEEAIKGVASATREYEKLQSGSNIVRNLGAIALGSFAFSAALKAVDVAVTSLTPSIGSFIDEQTGFAATSTRVTSALASQTLALHGNVDAALAAAEAQAGLSATAASALNSQLRLTTSVKAGALAQQQASELFRAGAGTGQGTPQGLFGGFGGLGGSALLGQQFGGGKGFTEQLSGDINALRGAGGKSPLDDVAQGLSYLTNPSVRTAVNEGAKQQGNPLFDVVGGLGDILTPVIGTADRERRRQEEAAAAGPQSAEEAKRLDNVRAYLDDLGKAAERGAPFVGNAAKVTYDYAKSTEEQAAGARAAAAAGDAYGYALATQSNIIVRANGRVVQSADEYRQALEQTATGRGRPDPETLFAQNRVQREAAVRAAERQQQFALQTQLPAQQALAHLAAPAPAIGTGIVAANADEQKQIVAGQQRSIQLQDQLNGYYAQGKQILLDTYKVPLTLVNSVQAIGQEIANTQAGIRNQSSAYQVAQYNFQLQIARRTLSDIGGLTGKNFGAGQSYLGTLEKQNLALSRQGQLLQFNLSQRQINFQTALAGFQTPGVTPEERQARVKEAQIEASFAQKQLDISKQIFGNQVQIVDISNLRQGADLAAQIGLLLQGRQLSIDTALAEEKLIRLQALQAKQVAEVGTYLQKVDNLAAQAMGEIQQLEIAAGRAMYGVARQVLNAYSLVIRGLTSQLSSGMTGTEGNPGKAEDDRTQYNATGAVGTTTGTTNMVMGEAGAETYAILRNPRAVLGNLGGGGSMSVTFGDVYVRNDNDIDEIARKVTKVMGRDAALKGLRSGA